MFFIKGKVYADKKGRERVLHDFNLKHGVVYWRRHNSTEVIACSMKTFERKFKLNE